MVICHVDVTGERQMCKQLPQYIIQWNVQSSAGIQRERLG